MAVDPGFMESHYRFVRTFVEKTDTCAHGNGASKRTINQTGHRECFGLHHHIIFLFLLWIPHMAHLSAEKKIVSLHGHIRHFRHKGN